MWRRLADRALALTPVLFGAPVLLSILGAAVAIVQVRHPYFGDMTSPAIDGQAFYLGEPLYQSPAAGYTTVLYTPLFPIVVGSLDHIVLWTGWPALIALVASLGLVAIAARLAYRGGGRGVLERVVAVVSAVSVGALCWWLVSGMSFNFLLAPRSDQMAWALALGGLVALPGAAGGSRRALVLALVLLSAAFWTKQTTVTAVAAAALWLGLAALAGAASRRDALVFAGALVGLNGFVFALASALSGGWAFDLTVALPTREAKVLALGTSARQLFESVALPLFFAAAVWLSIAVAVRVRPRAWPRDPVVAAASALTLFAVIGAAAAVYFQQKQGAVQNHFIGVAWALCLVGAAGWGRAGGSRVAAAGAAAVVLALFALSESDGLRRTVNHANVGVGQKSFDYSVGDLPAALRAFARGHSVYHPVFSDLNVPARHSVYQDYDNIQAMLSAGYQPGALVRTLLDRRFDAVYLFDESPSRERFASGFGKWEENYNWKLNQVLRARYGPPPPGLPSAVLNARVVPDYLGAYMSPGIRFRRPGPERAAWMRDCFGPFEIGGRSWRIAHGGGFWCRPGGRGGVLTMRGTPAPVSEVRSGRALASGAIGVTLPRRPGTAAEVACGASTLRLAVRGDGRALASVAAGSRRREALEPRDRRPPPQVRVQARFGARAALAWTRAGRAVASDPATGSCALSLRASRGSAASFDVGGLGTRSGRSTG